LLPFFRSDSLVAARPDARCMLLKDGSDGENSFAEDPLTPHDFVGYRTKQRSGNSSRVPRSC
jgi:hypothetical protein